MLKFSRLVEYCPASRDIFVVNDPLNGSSIKIKRRYSPGFGAQKLFDWYQDLSRSKKSLAVVPSLPNRFSWLYLLDPWALADRQVDTLLSIIKLNILSISALPQPILRHLFYFHLTLSLRTQRAVVFLEAFLSKENILSASFQCDGHFLKRDHTKSVFSPAFVPIKIQKRPRIDFY